MPSFPVYGWGPFVYFVQLHRAGFVALSKRPPMDFLFVPCGKGFQKIRLSCLLYIKAFKDHTELMTSEGLVITSAGIGQFEKRLRHRGFCRVHAAYLVALDKVIAFDRHSVELAGFTLPLEKKFMASFKECVRIIDPFAAPPHYQSLVVDAGGKLIRI